MITVGPTAPPMRITGRRFAICTAWGAMAFLLVAVITGCAGKKEVKSTQVPKPEARVEAPEGKPSQFAEAKPAPAPKSPNRPDMKVITREVTLVWQEAGKTKMQAFAKEIVGNELTGKGTMKDAKVLWYDNGKLTTVMNAPKIEAEQSTKTLIATGGVTVKSLPRKTVVKSQWMKWLANEHKIVGNGGVTVTSDVGTVNAAGLVADTELKTLTFTSQGDGGSASFNP